MPNQTKPLTIRISLHQNNQRKSAESVGKIFGDPGDHEVIDYLRKSV